MGTAKAALINPRRTNEIVDRRIVEGLGRNDEDFPSR